MLALTRIARFGSLASKVSQPSVTLVRSQNPITRRNVNLPVALSGSGLMLAGPLMTPADYKLFTLGAIIWYIGMSMENYP